MELTIIAMRPSRTALTLVVATATATLAMLLLIPGSLAVRAAAMSWSIAVACHALARHRRGHSVRIQGRSIIIDGVPGEVVEGSFVAPWLTIVHWRPPGARFTRTLPVLPDMLDPGAFRALRVILRWEGKIRA
jgi:hypothetical protein